MTSHTEVAAAVGRSVQAGATAALDCGPGQHARQGDVRLAWVGESTARGPGTGPAGVMIAAGRHGEHRLVAESYVREGDVIDLAGGGILIHTDVPDARHCAIRFSPGRRTVNPLRELRGGSIMEVQD